jgi:SOS-response transcriptional repressor LexA
MTGVGGIFFEKFASKDQCLERLMTPKQKEIFLVIDEWWIRYGFGPSIDDIMYMTGDRGRGNVHRIVKRLCEMGVCKRLPDRARSVRPVYIKFRNLE